MSRAADSTIKGFIYQFYKSIFEVLESTDETITLEGIIEDVDIVSDDNIRAIQCKYHESAEKYTESQIFKPIAQMMAHFKQNQEQDIQYILYAYFPNENTGAKGITTDLLDNIFLSTNVGIVKILKNVLNDSDFKRCFMSKFKFEIGKSMSVIEDDIIQKFVDVGFSKEEVEVVVFPKALEIVAKLSCEKEEHCRELNKESFLKILRAAKNVVMPIWILELKSYDKILKTMKKQVQEGLKQNVRKRGILFSKEFLDECDSDIINFIKSFIEIYYFKSVHTEPPLFCFFYNFEQMNKIKERLADKDIRFQDGYAGKKFVENWFFKAPLLNYDNSQIREHEFRLRLLCGQNLEILNSHKLDDLYVVGNINMKKLATEDIILHETSVKNIKELEFLFNIRGTYE